MNKKILYFLLMLKFCCKNKFLLEYISMNNQKFLHINTFFFFQRLFSTYKKYWWKNSIFLYLSSITLIIFQICFFNILKHFYFNSIWILSLFYFITNTSIDNWYILTFLIKFKVHFFNFFILINIWISFLYKFSRKKYLW